MNEIDSLLKQLHDIEGIDAVSGWPLAIGWWILIGLSIFILLMAGFLFFRRLSFRRNWRYDSLQKLNELEKSLEINSEETSREIVILFSEYLRRIAMRRFGRSSCAGLVGDAWLQWLSNRDEKKFDWNEKGKFLLQVPYAPIHQKVTQEQMKELIAAARNWVK